MRTIRVKERSGKCFLRVNIKGQDYSKVIGSYHSSGDRAQAAYIAEQATLDIARGTFTGFDAYIETFERPSKQGLISNLLSFDNHNFKAVMSKLMAYRYEVRNGGELQRFFDSLDVSEPTKARYLSCVRRAWPSSLWDGISFKQSVGAPDPFTNTEIEQILGYSKRCNITEILRFWHLHGLRTGEMAALNISDIDLDEMVVTVRHSWDAKKQCLKPTKTGKPRRVPLFVDDGYIKRCVTTEFPFSRLRNISNFVRDHWAPMLENLGIRYRNPYKLRHTFISRQVKEQKGDVVKVARWAGNSPAVIFKHYAGYLPD